MRIPLFARGYFLALAGILVAVPLFSSQAQTTIPQFLQLNFKNSSTYADSDIYFLFSTGITHTATSGNVTSTYANISGTILASGSFVAQELSGTLSAGGQYWTQGNIYSGTSSAFTGRYVGYTLEQLKGGIELAYADSVTAYVSLGTPMFLTGTAGQGSIETFGTPSLTALNDPNAAVRWQPFEITRTSTYVSGSSTNGLQGDQANVTAINAYAVPIQMQSFSGTSGMGTPLQTVRTVGPGLGGNSLQNSLVNLANANTGNSSNWGAISATFPNWQVTGSMSGTGPVLAPNGAFLRQVGPSSGATGILATATLGPGSTGLVPLPGGIGGGTYFTNNTGTVINNAAASSNGPYPTFQNYVAYVATGNSGTAFQTPLAYQNIGSGTNVSWQYSGTATAVAFGGTSISSTWLNRNGLAFSGSNTGSISLSGTGYAIQISGSIFSNGSASGTSMANTTPGSWVGSFVLTIPPDQTAANGGGSDTIGYNQTFSLYGSTLNVAGNYIEFTDLTGTASGLTGTYLRFSDLPYDPAVWSQVAHDLGVGYALGLIGSSAEIPGYATGTSLNDMGSAGWTAFKAIYTSGTYTGSAMPAYEAAWGGTHTGFYNQWSQVIYDNSQTVYGNPYSDFVQPVLLNVNNAPVTSQAIGSITIEILPDVIPEATTWTLLVAGGVAIYFVRRRKKQG